MKSFLFFLCLFTLSPLYSQFNWVEAIPPNALGQEVFLGVCTTPTGAVYATGYAGAGTNLPILQQYAANGTPGFSRSCNG
ncbi:MAG: hypothetical protein AAF597_14060, partial [Bacteroidota bacterium]